jgi:hypothetical protein
MRFGLLTSVVFAALVAAAPVSFAFEVQHTSNSSGAGANFSNNPDSQSDSMSANLAGDNTGNSPILHFGSSSMSFSGGSGGGYAPSPAFQEQFMGGPDQIGSAISPR